MSGDSLKKWMDESRKLQWDRNIMAKKAAELAAMMFQQVASHTRGDDKKTQALLHAWVKDEKVKDFTLGFFRDVLPIKDKAKAEHQLEKLIAKAGGIPSCFGRKASLKVSYLSFMSKGKVPSLLESMEGSFGSYYLLEDAFPAALRDDVKEGVRSSLCLLAPRCMGDHSAKVYQKSLLELMGHSQHVSIEVDMRALCYRSNLYHASQSVERLMALLQPLFEASVEGKNARPLVLSHLSSQTLPIMIEVLKRLLVKPPFAQIDLCVELPAYLPSCKAYIEDLAALAQLRTAWGGAMSQFPSQLKVLLIKGEHLDDERLSIYRARRGETISVSKLETDARFKLLLQDLIACPQLEPVVATHHLFDLSYAILLWAKSRRSGQLRFALMRGMGLSMARFLKAQGFEVMLQSCIYRGNQAEEAYCAFAQLIDDMAKSHPLMTLAYGSAEAPAEWDEHAQKFAMSIVKMETLKDVTPCAEGGRLSAVEKLSVRQELDLALKIEEDKALSHIEQYIDGKLINSPLSVNVRNRQTHAIEYSYDSLMHEHSAALLDKAKKALPGVEKDLLKRCAQLEQLADELEKQRHQLMALLVRDAGYTLADADHELAQSIACARTYSSSIKESGWRDGSTIKPLGVAVVAGRSQSVLLSAVEGVCLAWIAACSLVYRPSSSAPRLGLAFVDCLHAAGLREPFINMALCLDNQIADELSGDDSVLLSFPSGRRFVVDAEPFSQLNQQVIHPPKGWCSVMIAADSAWRRALLELSEAFLQRGGQLSATPHLLIVEASLYDSSEFQEALQDIFSSLDVNNYGAQTYPLTPEDWFLMHQLASGESFLLPFEEDEQQRSMVVPRIRMGLGRHAPILQEKRATCLPQLCVMRVADLDEALAVQRELSLSYRAAIYTKSADFIAQWRKHLPLSHAFINTPPTLLLPNLSPEGELNQTWGASGGRSIAPSLCQWNGVNRPELRSDKCQIPFTPWEMVTPRPTGASMMRLRAAADSISHWWEKEFGILHTLANEAGQWTQLRYDSVPTCIRAEKGMSDVDLCILLLVALKAGSSVELSLGSKREWVNGRLEPLGVKLYQESRKAYETRLSQMADKQTRIRDIHASETSCRVAREAGLHLITAEVIANGRIELMRLCRERYTSCCELI